MKKLLLVIAAVIAMIPFAKVSAAGYNITLGPGCDGSGQAIGTEMTCKIYAEPIGSMDSFAIEVTSKSGAQLKNIAANTTDWPNAKVSGSIVHATGTTKTATVLLATVTWNVTNAVDCGLNIAKTSAPTTPTNPSTPENPNTGSYMPYIFIAGGAIVAGVIYVLATKKTKFYKI